MAKVVQFQIKIEGSAEVKNVTVDAKQLADAFSEVKSEVKDLDTKLVTFSSRVKLLGGTGVDKKSEDARRGRAFCVRGWRGRW